VHGIGEEMVERERDAEKRYIYIWVYMEKQ